MPVNANLRTDNDAYAANLEQPRVTPFNIPVSRLWRLSVIVS